MMTGLTDATQKDANRVDADVRKMRQFKDEDLKYCDHEKDAENMRIRYNVELHSLCEAALFCNWVFKKGQLNHVKQVLISISKLTLYKQSLNHKATYSS